MPDTYSITTVLREDADGGLYRGVRRKDGAPVVIRTARTDQPLTRLRREWEILSRLEGPWVLRPLGLEEQSGQPRLVLEGFDGGLLSDQLERPLEIGRFLDLAVRLTAAVADLHRQGIVHKDLRPANILYEPGIGALKLVGLGIAARLSDIPTAPAGIRLVEGSPAYMSPEQTGRMNRGVDHRSDLYSLGVIFYGS